MKCSQKHTRGVAFRLHNDSLGVLDNFSQCLRKQVSRKLSVSRSQITAASCGFDHCPKPNITDMQERVSFRNGTWAGAAAQAPAHGYMIILL